MFVRTNRVTRNGKTYVYTQLVESYRRADDGMPQHRVIANLGALTQLERDNLKTALQAGRRGQHVVVATTRSGKKPPKPDASLRYLDVAVAHELWREWNLRDALLDIVPQGDSAVLAADCVEVLTVQRLVAPSSKLAAVRWFPTTALPELLGVAPQRFNNTRIHRVLDELELATPALMAKLPRMYRERDGAFASLFMDVTDTWFVGHGPDSARTAKTKEGRLERKIGIVLLCNERGFPLRWEVIPGNSADAPAMLDMVQSVAGLDWVGDAPVVLDRAMGHTACIRSIGATNLKFVTALTRPEFPSYANELPCQSMASLACVDYDSADVVAAMTEPDNTSALRDLAAQAARQALAAGMDKVDNKLFLRDFGLVSVAGENDDRPTCQESVTLHDPGDNNARALKLARHVRQATLDGRHASKAAAAAAVGLKRATLHKYEHLLGLTEDLQRRVLDGAVATWPLAHLLRIAKNDDAQAQRVAFETLLRSTPPRRLHKPVSASTSMPNAKATSANPPLRVRVIAYFNPEQFVQQRRTAAVRMRRVRAFVAQLNNKLASPRSRQTPHAIRAAVETCLRREELVRAFDVTVVQHDSDTSTYYQVALELNAADWQRRRLYDGFSVLVASSELPHTAEALCKLYRAKDMVERDFRTIKSTVELRPVRHRTDLKIRAHVTLCMLALLLERTLRRKLADKFTAERALELLETCRLNRYPSEDGPAVYTVTALDKQQRALLRRLRMLHIADDDDVASRLLPR